MEYIFEDIEEIEQLEDFNGEEVYDIEVCDNSHTFIANDILVHNSSYTTYQPLFDCFDEESKKRYDTDEKKLQFIIDFNAKFLDKQNFEWLNQKFNLRHGKNIHNFELETVSKSCIYLKKKKYIKKLVYKDGKYLLDHPKVSGTGIEIIKSTTPKLCRKILTELTRILMDEFNNYEDKTEFTIYFNTVLSQFRNEFYEAPIDDISQSIGVGDYNKYIINDKEQLVFEKGTPVSVKAIARFNYLAHKNGEDDKVVFSGKIKYYRMYDGKNTEYFGFPAGECPSWAPKISKIEQWNATVIEPINRFLEVMNIPLVNAAGTIQYTLF